MNFTKVKYWLNFSHVFYKIPSSKEISIGTQITRLHFESAECNTRILLHRPLGSYLGEDPQSFSGQNLSAYVELMIIALYGAVRAALRASLQSFVGNTVVQDLVFYYLLHLGIVKRMRALPHWLFYKNGIEVRIGEDALLNCWCTSISGEIKVVKPESFELFGKALVCLSKVSLWWCWQAVLMNKLALIPVTALSRRGLMPFLAHFSLIIFVCCELASGN